MRIITCTGFGNSGSSAATDFFSEFENIQLLPHSFECTFLHEPDGLYDLEKAVEEGHRFKVDLAVKRFLALSKKLQKENYKSFFDGQFLNITKKFISRVISCKWSGWWHRCFEVEPLSVKQKILFFQAEFKFKRGQHYYQLYENDSWRPAYMPPCEEYYESDIDNFKVEAKKYVLELMYKLNPNNKEFLLIDQLLPPIHTELYCHFFDDIKVIIVDRDPRDYYLSNNLFWGSRYLPTEDCRTYINWYNKTRSLINNTANIKRIYLEDFIYNYDFITKNLMDYIGINESYWIKRRTKFIPNNSKINTRLFERYCNYTEELKVISESLSDYLFDYEKKEFSDFEVLKSMHYEKPILTLLQQEDKLYRSGKVDVCAVFALVEKLFKILISFFSKKFCYR